MKFKFAAINPQTKVKMYNKERKLIRKLNTSRNHKLWSPNKDLVDSIKKLDKVRSSDITELKKTIKKRLIALHGGQYCFFCNKEIENMRLLHIEHILPKANYSYLTFSTINLTLACDVCNMDYKKQKIYLRNANSNYRGCTFSIVHPYLDNVDDHLDYSGFIVGVNNQSIKGANTINEFKLNREELLKARIIELFFIKEVDGDLLDLVRDTLTNNYN
ncbi:MAG: hypothetical protein HRT42_11370 [Campylobacteraceae bacterium]|nr:hypothetical protein [Campylobacteraceae bacterium]